MSGRSQFVALARATRFIAEPLERRTLLSLAPAGPEFRVNTFTTGPQTRPDAAADTSGNFVTVWQSNGQDGSNFGIFGQRYSQIVPVELMHFRVE